MSRPVCGACGELDVTSDPCRCHPPAPLDAAVEEAREALGEIPPNAEDTRITSLIRCAKALRSLLAALDADKPACEPGVICPTCVALEEAEGALEEITDLDCDGWCGCAQTIARRYFARREGEKGEKRG